MRTSANTNSAADVHFSKGQTKANFIDYEARAAECGGEVLYGLDKELAEKAAAKYDHQLEAACRAWVQEVAGVVFADDSSLQEELKSGIVLCKLANAIRPGVCPKPSTMKAPFKQMENIASYLAACDVIGVPQHSQFQTVALYENKDMMQVLTNLQAVGSAAQTESGYKGPPFGAKLAKLAPREFSEGVIAAGKASTTFIGMGSYGQPGTQSGMFDTSREIIKTDA
eukprot:CAMPEP_0119059052 /NCGR_PEP_ID=MMETSP1178-20130426/3273_1 /TAXON_ID=33656 /ORGANISM="unid sp, Strain CCMP2000" /LENGTH=225 /DNA_ID=CAMNT_0007040055 /DNA_START=75 /DNA_END=749 /DNA_ORIENTATION=+